MNSLGQLLDWPTASHRNIQIFNSKGLKFAYGHVCEHNTNSNPRAEIIPLKVAHKEEWRLKYYFGGSLVSGISNGFVAPFMLFCLIEKVGFVFCRHVFVFVTVFA